MEQFFLQSLAVKYPGKLSTTFSVVDVPFECDFVLLHMQLSLLRVKHDLNLMVANGSLETMDLAGISRVLQSRFDEWLCARLRKSQNTDLFVSLLL